MTQADLTVAILREIRDGIGETNARLDTVKVELKAEMAGLRDEVRQTNARLAVVEQTLKDLAAQLLMLAT